MDITGFTDRLALPAVCAPMFLVSGPELVSAACCSGIVGGLPRANARTVEEFAGWLRHINSAREEFSEKYPDKPVGPIAVNLPRAVQGDELDENLAVCAEHDVDVVINAQGNPTELVKRVHDWGGTVWQDVTQWRFAEKAVASGVDGITCVGYGGGGHSGIERADVLVGRLRHIFDGLILYAGGVTTGADIAAARALGADMAYLGTRFIATTESRADPAHKRFIVESDARDLVYASVGGRPPANWLKPSLVRAGVSPEAVDAAGLGGNLAVPDGVRPWTDLWSAGQGIGLIDSVEPVADVVAELERCYEASRAAMTRTPTGPLGP